MVTDEVNDLQKVIKQFMENMEKENKLNKSQQKIINAALNLFSKKGYEHSSTSDIAKEAGVAEVTIFRNFKSKNNLLFQIIAPLIIKITSPVILRDVKKQFNEEQSNSDDILKAVFTDRLELLKKNEQSLQVLLREAINHKEISESIINHITIPAKEEANKFVQKRKESGELRDINEQAMVDMLFYTLMGYVMSRHVFNLSSFTDDTEVMVDTYVDILINGMKRKDEEGVTSK